MSDDASTIDLSALPPPAVVEVLDFEAILQAMKDDFVSRYPEFSADLESDPVVKLLEVAAYRETLLRGRVNDAARAVMLATAVGTDLDNLGALIGVERLDGEADDRFRQRIVLGWERITTAGSRGSYRYHALTASTDVRKVKVFMGEPGTVRVIVLAGDTPDGAPTDALLDTVRDALNAEHVRPLTDTVSVEPAEIVPYVVFATLDLDVGPDPEAVRAAAEAAVLEYTRGQVDIGALVARSGIIAALHRSGVRSVALTLPATDLELTDTQAPHLADLTVRVGDD